MKSKIWLNRNLLMAIASIFLLVFACKHDPFPRPIDPGPQWPAGTTPIPATTQRVGDPTNGKDYLLNGDYVASGIPFAIYKTVFGNDPNNYLGRTGDNATIAPEYTALDAPNGVRVVAPNCMQCHAQKLMGNYVLGLGNSTGDYTTDGSAVIGGVDAAVNLFYGNPSPEWTAYAPFRRGILASGPHLLTEVVGANPADKLAVILSAHRDPVDLSWISTPVFEIPAEVIPADVPAWWLLKKKNAMFYAGVGRGDFGRFLMASSLLTMEDSAEARVIDNHFADVLAYIKTLEPPTYPDPIDQVLVAEGEKVFEQHCAACHGTYGPEGEYPNLLVDLATIGTDSLLSARNFSAHTFQDWYNNGWFGEGTQKGEVVAEGGYIAPPLDGVWATAPYLHNGSVPTLAALLNSPTRPTYWRRSFSTDAYDLDKVGWVYTEESTKTDKQTYDTTLPGYENGGHLFGDVLSDAERDALIAYVKGL